jgi:hypothetical protein
MSDKIYTIWEIFAGGWNVDNSSSSSSSLSSSITSSLLSYFAYFSRHCQMSLDLTYTTLKYLTFTSAKWIFCCNCQIFLSPSLYFLVWSLYYLSYLHSILTISFTYNSFRIIRYYRYLIFNVFRISCFSLLYSISFLKDGKLSMTHCIILLV